MSEREKLENLRDSWRERIKIERRGLMSGYGEAWHDGLSYAADEVERLLAAEPSESHVEKELKVGQQVTLTGKIRYFSDSDQSVGIKIEGFGTITIGRKYLESLAEPSESHVERARKLQEFDSIVRSALKREMTAPANHQSFQEEASEKLARWDALLAAPSPVTEAERKGAELIAAERQRQVEKEGWTAQHDKNVHYYGELAEAAICYAKAKGPEANRSKLWPWEPKWWKPKDRISNLVRAGALIAAEIDRLLALRGKDSR